MANVGVEALLTWLNNLELTDQPLHIEDLKDGTYLLKVINTLKNERGLSLDLSVEERFNQIARFLEGDCRLRAGTGATLSRHIANGNNLTVEISKVLLLLVYYDMMNNRSTLNKMELKVEGEIASLTERFVLVTDDYVYLSNGLEAYLGRKYSSSPSTQSSSSLISDDSPVFHRSQKVKFVDLHTVASPAASSRSPLQEVMNSPRFKLRKMQTQMIHEREYKDGLTRELSSLMTQIAQKETEISQLKYKLDKINEHQNVQDQVVSEQINELETKNESLQRRLHELAKQSHDLKSDTIHMERKVDQLTEENGNLSVQVREMRLKLATCEAELERLLENQATVEKELQSQNCHLQAELSQATAQKDFQYEQIEILQGKISSLEEELSRIRLEEKGENMGPVMQRAELENEITDLKDQLEITTGSLREAKQVVQAKEVLLAQYQEDITLHKELLKQQMAKSEKEMQDKQVLLDQTQKEIADQRHILQQEKNNLQLQVDSIGALLKESEEDAKLKEEQMLQKNTRHDTALEQQKTFYQDEMGRLKEEIQQKQELIELLKVRGEKVELLNQEIQTLRNEVETLTSSLKKAEEYLQTQEDLLAKQQLDSLKIQETLQNKITMFQEEVHGLWVEEVALQADVKLAKETIRAKEDMLANLQMESSQQTDILNEKMHGLEGQLKTITTTLSNAKQDLKTQQDMCNLHQQEHAHQLEELQKQMFASEEEIERLVQEIIQKEQQMTEVKKETSAHSEELQQEINSLMSQVTGVTDSLRKAEEKLQDRETLLTQQEQESAHQKDLLQKQVSACEEELEKMKREIKTKEEQLTLLGRNGSEQSALLQEQIQGLNSQVESLSSSLKQTEEEVLGQKHQLSKQELESTQQMEALQQLNLVSEENIRLLKEEIQTKETLLNEIRTESSKQSENLANRIQHLTLEMDNTKESLKMASEEVEAKEDVLTNLRQERDQLKTTMEVCEEEKALLKQDILLKEQRLTEVKKETSANSEELQQEINSLMSQVTGVTDSLRKAEEKLQDRETLLTQQEQESARQKELLRKQVSACEEEVEKMKREIKTKEEQLTLLGLNGSEQSALLQQQIQGLNSQVESLSSSLKQTEEEVLGQKHQLSKQELESTQQMDALQQLNLVSEENLKLLKEEIQTKETLLNEIRTESSKRSENLSNQIQHLTLEMDDTKESLKMASEEVEAKEDVLTNLRQERDQLKTTMEVCEEEKALLKEEILLKGQQLTEVKKETSTNSEELQQEINSLMSQVTGVTDSLRKAQEKLQDRETLLNQQDHQAAKQKDLRQKQVSASEVEVEMLKQEIKSKEEQLTLLGQNGSEQTAFLQQKIEVLTNQVDSHSFSMKEAEKDIQTASDAAKHYKTQMENAMNHYKAKKQLLLESQEQVAEMQRSLDVKEKIGTEFKLLQLDFESVKSNEKNLLSRVTSLEAQLAFADGQLREHNKMRRYGGRLQDSYFTETGENWKIQTRELKEQHDSFDSQGDDTLEDSLSTTRRPSAPGESSTPMVRSSERLAGKRRSLSADSLESLYFTPMNNKQTNRTKRHMDNSLTSLAELPDSTLKNLSSVKRRRTTQVINITMSKKTPRRGGSDNDHRGEDEDSFYSLASARSHPNLSNSHAARPVSMELSGKTAPSSDQLMSLPGYRRSNISTSSTTAPTRSTSTLCVGAENEPENGPDDWVRIAELQSRNKACLPHLKSSYPLESRPSIGPEFVITDDDLRMGDPTDTIRRATLMPGQMLDSLSSHRLSYMVGQTDTAGTRAHRHSLLPGQLPARTHSSSLQKYPLSPEAKASCFPRPLTPKYKNSHMTSSSTQIRTALSPIQRRESTVFTIENTPKKNSYLQKGLNRLRSSTRKSPGKGPTTSAAQRASGRSPGNRAAEVGVAVARRGNTRALPQGAAAAAAAKGQGRSPRTSAKSTAKSPRTSAKSTTNSQLLTSSARKMMSRRKV
ncbi:unnamed protein product [Boreogadus saida]